MNTNNYGYGRKESNNEYAQYYSDKIKPMNLLIRQYSITVIFAQKTGVQLWIITISTPLPGLSLSVFYCDNPEVLTLPRE
jgi:hypothetical protein